MFGDLPESLGVLDASNSLTYSLAFPSLLPELSKLLSGLIGLGFDLDFDGSEKESFIAVARVDSN